MDVVQSILAAMGVQLVIAGGMGGVARWIFVVTVDRKVAVKQGLSMILLGAILGFYVSPNALGVAESVMSKFGVDPDPDKLPSFTAFAIGVIGIGVVGAILDWWKGFRKPSGDLAVDPTSTKPKGDAL